MLWFIALYMTDEGLHFKQNDVSFSTSILTFIKINEKTKIGGQFGFRFSFFDFQFGLQPVWFKNLTQTSWKFISVQFGPISNPVRLGLLIQVAIWFGLQIRTELLIRVTATIVNNEQGKTAKLIYPNILSPFNSELKILYTIYSIDG